MLQSATVAGKTRFWTLFDTFHHRDDTISRRQLHSACFSLALVLLRRSNSPHSETHRPPRETTPTHRPMAVANADFAIHYFDVHGHGGDVDSGKERCRPCKILGSPVKDAEGVIQHDGGRHGRPLCQPHDQRQPQQLAAGTFGAPRLRRRPFADRQRQSLPEGSSEGHQPSANDGAVVAARSVSSSARPVLRRGRSPVSHGRHARGSSPAAAARHCAGHQPP